MNTIKKLEIKLHSYEDHLRLCYNSDEPEEEFIKYLIEKKHNILDTLALRLTGEKIQSLLASFYRGETITTSFTVFNSLNQDFTHLGIPVQTEVLDQYTVQWKKVFKPPRLPLVRETKL